MTKVTCPHCKSDYDRDSWIACPDCHEPVSVESATWEDYNRIYGDKDGAKNIIDAYKNKREHAHK